MSLKLNLARLLIGTVTFFNVQCAALFLLQPAVYAPGFELHQAGAPGAAMVRGLGLLFLMWNVPYAVALNHPARRWVSLCEAATMQAIGFLGESALLALLEPGHAALRATVTRFIWFDGAGLLALLAALWLAWPLRHQRPARSATA